MKLSEPSRSGKVLVYLFGSLGDTVVAIPALRAVRRAFPDSEVVLLQNVQDNLVIASEVVPRDLVDRYLNYKNSLKGASKYAEFYRLWIELRKERFDSVVYLVISERPRRAVIRDKLFFRACGIANHLGFHALTAAELFPVDQNGRPASTDSEAVRKLRRIQLDGISINPQTDLRQPFIPISDEERNEIDGWLDVRRKKHDSQLVAIAPGCKTVANSWGISNFAEIGSKLISEHGCEIIVVGGPSEFQIGEQMVSSWGEGINAAGEFSVRKSAALLSACDFYIGLDTGTTHLAAAVGTRCFALYGERNNPGHWFPDGNGHKIVYHPVACAGCRLFECSLDDHPCMKGMSVAAVWEELIDFMKKSNLSTEVVAV